MKELIIVNAEKADNNFDFNVGRNADEKFRFNNFVFID